MKKAIIIILATLLLATTNPTKQEYETWLKEQVMNESTGIIGKGLAYLYNNSGAIESSTLTKNYVVFSTYTTKTGDTELKVIGILKNFIVLKTEGNS